MILQHASNVSVEVIRGHSTPHFATSAERRPSAQIALIPILGVLKFTTTEHASGRTLHIIN